VRRRALLSRSKLANMFTVRTISLTLLFLEAIALAFLSFFGFYFAIAGIYSFISGIDAQLSLLDFVAFLMLFTSLSSFWRILFWVAVNGQKKKLPNLWWILATIGAFLTLISPFLYQKTNSYGLMWFVFGYLFLPTYFHLLFESKRQKGTACPIKALQKFKLNS
jgi:hypothetical protein